MRSTRRLSLRPYWLRLPRRTARVRLTVLYGGLFLVAGAGLLAFTYWLFERTTAGTVTAPGGWVSTACKGGGPSRPGFSSLSCKRLGEALHEVHAVDLHALVVQSAIALAVVAALAVALGWLVAGRVLRPLRAITATARRISATSLHERLALAGPDDEFRELADTLDQLLARLEASFQAQRNFVASASHELRTPLTLDRTLLQVALRDAGATVGQWRSTGREVLESGRQQERLLEALLTLASSEGGLSHRDRVDLAEATTAGLLAASTEIEHQGAPRQDVDQSRTPAGRPGPRRALGRQPPRQRRASQHSRRYGRGHRPTAGRLRRSVGRQ